MAAPTMLVSATANLVGKTISVPPSKGCGSASEVVGLVLSHDPATNLYKVCFTDGAKDIQLPSFVNVLNGHVTTCADDDIDSDSDGEDAGTSGTQSVPLTTFQKGQTVTVPAEAFGEEWEEDHRGETYSGTLKGIVRIELDGAIIWDVDYGKDGDCETDEAYFEAESTSTDVVPRVAWPTRPSMEVLRYLGPFAEGKWVEAMLAACPAWCKVLCIGQKEWTRSLDFRNSWVDDYLACVADTDDLQKALREIGEWGATQRELLASPEARGTALELLLAVWQRLQTDGPAATSAALLLAGVWAWRNEVDLGTANVSKEPFNVQILANMIRLGLFEQNADYSIAYGPKMRAYVAKQPNNPLGAADLLVLAVDAAFMTAQDGKMCNGAQCKFGVQRLQQLLDLLRDARVRARYGTATVKEALDAFGAFPVLGSDFDIKDVNLWWANEVGKEIGRVIDDPTKKGLCLRLQCPKTGKLLCVPGYQIYFNLTRPARRRRRGVAATPSTPSREVPRSGFVGAAAAPLLFVSPQARGLLF